MLPTTARSTLSAVSILSALLVAVEVRNPTYGPIARSIDALLVRFDGAAALGPVFGFTIGVLLGISPVALPSIPAVVTVLTPTQVGDEGHAPRLPILGAVPVVAAFVLGMNGVVAIAGFVFVEVTVALARASVVLHVIAAIALAVAGVRLVSRRTSLCRRVRTLPPTPGAAFVYGVGFSVGGCPGCAPVSLGVGAATALVAGPLYALGVLLAFVAGHTAVLLAAATAGARFIGSADPDSPRWARLDRVVGLLFLAAAAYYVFRVASGTATTILPGEPGGLLP